MLVSLEFDLGEVVYESTPLPVNTQRNFLAGPGEGLPFHAINMHFEGVIRIDGTLLRYVLNGIPGTLNSPEHSVSARKRHVMFSTRDPPTIQRMPWPIGEDDDMTDVTPASYDTWILNDIDFAWLVESDG